ncbi:hypothetical protein GGR56DRAFT_681245 [Xylariaceae sp. FL0804]|nr:hypothetical protein GGR56DRAFT_681245 [Xylariaceae sp. FL0804]
MGNSRPVLDSTDTASQVTMDRPESHSIISPAILYWGTPVVLITTLNDDDGGSSNISPMSSAWWLGHSCVLGLLAESQTTRNLLRTRQCVLNLPDDSAALVAAVDALAGTTGSDPVSPAKAARGYRFVRDKWARAGLEPQPSDLVAPARVRQCPVQMEAEVVGHARGLRPDLPDREGLLLAVEVRILRIHIVERLRMEGHANRVDPDRWNPLFMCFQEFYGKRQGKLTESVLGRVPEEEYRALTRSDVEKLPGDEDDKLAEAQLS